MIDIHHYLQGPVNIFHDAEATQINPYTKINRIITAQAVFICLYNTGAKSRAEISALPEEYKYSAALFHDTGIDVLNAFIKKTLLTGLVN